MHRAGIDYSYHGPIYTASFQAAGATFVVRYLSESDHKNLHRDEADLLSDAGLDLCVVWETLADRALAGRDGGVADAHKAAGQAKECGMPDGRPIYFAVDYDAPDQDKPTIAAYLAGAASVLGGANRVGVYGGYWVVAYCLDHNAADFAWQTLAWSGGRRDPRAQLYQHTNGVMIGGISCDLDSAYATDFGQWRSTILPPPPPFPYPQTDYLATARPDSHSHWGETAADRANVAEWQKKMAQRGWHITPTGTFGKQSDRICRSFQTEKRLTVDGKVGPVTWAASWTAPIA
jgi:peptidoglycan hydrolase-like protein with peptidoglycan-binding domain